MSHAHLWLLTPARLKSFRRGYTRMGTDEYVLAEYVYQPRKTRNCTKEDLPHLFYRPQINAYAHRGIRFAHLWLLTPARLKSFRRG